jgi:hypothetical protein
MGVKFGKEKRRVRVSQNRLLRGRFGPKRAEVTGDWRNVQGRGGAA